MLLARQPRSVLIFNRIQAHPLHAVLAIQAFHFFGGVGLFGVDQGYCVQSVWKAPETIAHITVVVAVVHALDEDRAVDLVEVHVADEVFDQPRVFGPLGGHVVVVGERRLAERPHVYVRIYSHDFFPHFL